MTNEEIDETLQYLIGSRYVPSVKAYISEITGLEMVVSNREPVPLNFDPMRLHVIVDGAGLVSGFSFK
ncbi:hypothetical protein ACKUFS_23060 [Pseudomonas cannabina]|nr:MULTISPECIES: hypothetical protein [Pseudomonas syringae group]KPB70150.1 Uncharacterized protein AC507_4749 [Pseudomonas syringae pv. maculicola]MBM0140359.1 hypothetical protein [Pseudomonas cannabina pv. alisalensis]QHE95197.1 hypothetical protein PMA4326_000110 [Pseudomonas syringae pv. maculicola str. ES4326]QQN22182.1 hypothetical protein JGS08_00105 [Pseudomonas cannabina pv. alisalensis]UBY95825.1 hypothetical protein LCG56_17630 [Pseudomonas cannabina pv. alisalensis]